MPPGTLPPNRGNVLVVDGTTTSAAGPLATAPQPAPSPPSSTAPARPTPPPDHQGDNQQPGADQDHGGRDQRSRGDAVIVAPSERVVVDVLFPYAGELELQHRTPDRTYRLASIVVGDEQAEPSHAEEFARLRINRDMEELREWIEPFLKAPPDKSLAFVAEMNLEAPEGGTAVYVCPDAPRGDERQA